MNHRVEIVTLDLALARDATAQAPRIAALGGDGAVGARTQPQQSHAAMSDIKRPHAAGAMTHAQLATVKTVPDPMPAIDARKVLRAELMAQIQACTDGDDLTSTLALNLDYATRAGEHMLLRGDVMNAVAARFKELNGRKLAKAEIETLFPKPSKKALDTLMLPLSEFGVTARLKSAHGHALMYAADLKCWYIYTSGYWQQEATDVRVVEKARAIVKTLRPTADAIADDYLREQMLGKVEACERTSFARGAVAGLAGEEGIITDSLQLDTHVELLGAKNGIIALRTGLLLPADPAARITLSTACNYVPGASAPWFERTVHDVFKGNAELIAFVKRLLGYTLLACPTERLMIIPIGGGKNGKSTIFNAIQETLGAHAGKMGSETIAAPSNAPYNANPGAPREDLLRLRGKRVVFAAEMKRGTTFNDNTVKELASGGDLITARALFSTSSVEFRPTCVVVAPTNVLPMVRDDDPAVWDRLLLLPFTQRFGEEGTPAIDLLRSARLRCEAEGILAWLVEGAIDYQRDGLQVPECVHALKRQHREGSSPIGVFIDEYCLTGPQCVESTRSLFAAWKICAAEQGEKFTAQTLISFGRAMASRGFESCLVSTKDGRTKGWRGIKLKDGRAQLLQERAT